MKRRIVAALGVVALAGAVACNSDQATAPDAAAPPPPPASRLSLRQQLALSGDTVLRVGTLTRNVPLAQDLTTSGVIGRQGGYIQIPEAGVLLYVPRGVVRDRGGINFTITAKAGSAVAYEFGPEGSRFQDALVIVQDLNVTNWAELPDPLALEGGYFASDAQLDAGHGKAVVSEFVYTDVDVRHARALIWVNHFSGYVIATGKSYGTGAW